MLLNGVRQRHKHAQLREDQAATPSHSNVVQAGQAGRAKNPLPQLGQPGARDDPNPKALSGARTKWYLHYLQQGRSPAEALSLAKTPQPLEQKPNSASKRANTTLTPPTETPKRQKVEKSPHPFDGPRQVTRRSFVSGQELEQKPNSASKRANTTLTHPTETPKRQKVEKSRPLTAPFDGPSTSGLQRQLSIENLSQLEDALLEEIVRSGWVSPIKFGGIHFRVGHLIVDCRNATTAEWLQSAVPSLSKWSGVSLEVRMGDDSLLSLGVDDNSCAKIISSDHKLSFRISAEKKKPNKLSESSEDLADDEDLDATIIEMGDQTQFSSQELGGEVNLLSKEEAIPVDGDLGISRSAM
ncbi:GD17674 [Drosophila simulans]|uniref:GD17674 n=1 Tax=Drosophila simulans TaxID=7240 RepID=B4NSU4_DROSI|nr:GD17674 [Drosophila simulans]